MTSSKRFLGLVLACVVAGPLMAADSGSSKAQGPVAVVRAASQQVLEAMTENASKLKNDPALAEKLVKEYLLPHFDFDFTSQLVLGRAWRTATPEQRKAFQEAFLHYLTTTYAKGIQGFDGAKVQVLPFRGDTSKQFVTVKTQVTAANHNPVSVDYVLHKTADGWKAFDVKIAGVSYVQTYRNEFQSEIQHTSLKALIERLQKAQSPAGDENKK
ncbi:MAG: ABC transporter substrate-binding protein [Gammaproteobacteria bacterium]